LNFRTSARNPNFTPQLVLTLSACFRPQCKAVMTEDEANVEYRRIKGELTKNLPPQ